jgi:hypothetical protein
VDPLLHDQAIVYSRVSAFMDREYEPVDLPVLTHGWSPDAVLVLKWARFHVERKIALKVQAKRREAAGAD